MLLDIQISKLNKAEVEILSAHTVLFLYVSNKWGLSTQCHDDSWM